LRCSGYRERQEHQRDCEATHAASILRVWRPQTAARRTPVSR
jgi:uncharacterized cysteine cluster protein YcgN (CxxCxxCC family)